MYVLDFGRQSEKTEKNMETQVQSTIDSEDSSHSLITSSAINYMRMFNMQMT